jgi:hypothetical protein
MTTAINAFRDGVDQLIVDVALAAQEAGPAAVHLLLGRGDQRPPYG